MAERDLEAASALRCSDDQIRPERRALSEDQLDRMLSENGELGLSRAEIEDDPAAFGELASLVDPTVVNVWLTFDGSEASDPVLLFVGDEDGERRICGYAQPRVPLYTDMTSDALVDLGPMVRSLAELIDVPVPTGLREVDPEMAAPVDPPDPTPGFVETVRRAFQTGDYGGVTLTATRLESPEATRRLAEQRVHEVLGDAVGVDLLLDPHGAFTIQVAAFSWTWVQPGTAWPLFTRTDLLYGDVVVEVQQSALHADEDDAAWLTLVPAVHQLATATG